MNSLHVDCHERLIMGKSPLFNVIAENDPDAINILQIIFLTTEVTINDKIDSLDNTALHFAVIKDRKQIVKFLLSKSPDHNARNGDGDTPLHIAIKSNNIPIAKLLLSNGSDLNATNEFGLTSFMISIWLSNKEMIEFLIKYVDDIHKYSKITPNNVLTPLNFAVDLVRIDVVELLIANSTDVNYCASGNKNTPLHCICLRQLTNKKLSNETAPEVEKIFEILIKAGADLNAIGQNGATPLLLAIKASDYTLIEILVRNGCNLNIPLPNDELSRTPLHLAVIHPKWKKMLDLFLRFGADYKKIDDFGITPYHCAMTEATNNKLQIAQTFWKYGCPYELAISQPVNIARMFPFHKKMYENFEDIFHCQKLLFEGIRSNNVKIVQNALKIGAIVRGTSVEMKYPLHFVSSKGYIDVARLLLAKGIKVNNLNSKKETAIQCAVKYRHVNICKLLLCYGAYLNCKEEILKLKTVNVGPGKEIKDLFKSINLWFRLVKQGDPVIFDLMKDMFETDKEMFLIHVNALDKNKRSLMASAIYYKHTKIVEEIMKNRINYTLSLTHN